MTSTASPTRMSLLRKAATSKRARQWASSSSTSNNNNMHAVSKDDTVSTVSTEEAASTSPDATASVSSSTSSHRDRVKTRLAKAMMKSNNKSDSTTTTTSLLNQHQSTSTSREALRQKETLTQRRRRIVSQRHALSPSPSMDDGSKSVTTPPRPSCEEEESLSVKSQEVSSVTSQPDDSSASSKREELAMRVMNGSSTTTPRRPLNPLGVGNDVAKRETTTTPEKPSNSPFSTKKALSDRPMSPATKPPMAPPKNKKPASPPPSPTDEDISSSHTRVIANGRAEIETPASQSVASLRASFAKNAQDNSCHSPENPQDQNSQGVVERFANPQDNAAAESSSNSGPALPQWKQRLIAAQLKKTEELPQTANSGSPPVSKPKSTTQDQDNAAESSESGSSSPALPLWKQRLIAAQLKRTDAEELPLPPTADSGSPPVSKEKSTTQEQENASTPPAKTSPDQQTSPPSPFPSWMTEKKFPKGVHDGKPLEDAASGKQTDESSSQFPSWMTEKKFPQVHNGKPYSKEERPRFPLWMTDQKFPVVHNGKPSWVKEQDEKVGEESENVAGVSEEKNGNNGKPSWIGNDQSELEEEANDTTVPEVKEEECEQTPEEVKPLRLKKSLLDKTFSPASVESTDSFKDFAQDDENVVTPNKKPPKFRPTWSTRAERSSPAPTLEQHFENHRDTFGGESNVSTPERQNVSPQQQPSPSSTKALRGSSVPFQNMVDTMDNDDTPRTRPAGVIDTDIIQPNSHAPLQRTNVPEANDVVENDETEEETPSETPSKSLSQMAMDSVFAIDYHKLVAMELDPSQNISFEDDGTISTAGSKDLPCTPMDLPKELQDIMGTGACVPETVPETESPQREEAESFQPGVDVSQNVSTEKCRSPVKTYSSSVPRLAPSMRDKERSRDRPRGGSIGSPEKRRDKYQPAKKQQTPSLYDDTGEAVASEASSEMDSPDEQLSPSAINQIRGLSSSTSPEAQRGSDAGSSVVFGDPQTFGSAADDVPGDSPPVSERVKAVEDWQGGQGETTPGSFPTLGSFPAVNPYSLYSPPDDSPSKIRASWSPPEDPTESPSKIRASWSPPEDPTESPSKIRASWSPPDESQAQPAVVAENTKAVKELPHRTLTPEKSILKESVTRSGKKAESYRVRFSEPPAPRLTDEYSAQGIPYKSTNELPDSAKMDRDVHMKQWQREGPAHFTDMQGGLGAIEYWAESEESNNFKDADEWMNKDPEFNPEISREANEEDEWMNNNPEFDPEISREANEEDEWMDRDPDLGTSMLRGDSDVSDASEAERYAGMEKAERYAGVGTSPEFSVNSETSDQRRITGRKELIVDAAPEAEDPFVQAADVHNYEAVKLSTPRTAKKAFDPFMTQSVFDETFDFDGDSSFFSNEENSFFSAASGFDDSFHSNQGDEIFPSSTKKKKKKKGSSGRVALRPPPKSTSRARDDRMKKNRRVERNTEKFDLFDEPVAKFEPAGTGFGEKPGDLLEI